MIIAFFFIKMPAVDCDAVYRTVIEDIIRNRH